MATMQEKRDETATRRELIVEYFLNNANKEVTVKTLSKLLMCPDQTIRNDFVRGVRDELNKTGRLVHSTSHTSQGVASNFIYIPNEAPEAKDETPKYENPWVNHEGYSDPTVRMAMKDELEKPVMSTGELWETQASNGSTEVVVVVRPDSSGTLIIPAYLKEEMKCPVNRTYTKGVTYRTNGVERTYMFDIRNLKTKPNRYFTRRLFTLNETTSNNLRQQVAELIFKDESAAKLLEKNKFCEAKIADMEKLVKSRNEDVAELKEQVKIKEAKITGLKAEYDEAYQSNLDLAAKIKELEARKDPANNVNMSLMLLLLQQKIDIYERLLFGKDEGGEE